MAAGGDRLSGLSDDLLRRVLHFVPSQEGALTTALSRRWRPLWRSCGAVNLVARALKDDVNDRYSDEARGRFYARRDAVAFAAHKALAAAAEAEAHGNGRVTKLTVRVEARTDDKVRDFLYHDLDWRKKHDVFAAVLSHHAARRVEELQIAGVDSDDGTPMFFERSKYEESSNINGLGIFPLDSLPSKTPRVLEITNCSDPVLRRLERLELQGVYSSAGKVPPEAAIENLLSCCPALRDLRINLSTSHEDANKKYQYGEDFSKRKRLSEFQESVNRFKRRRAQTMMVAGDEQDGVNYDEVPDLLGLSGHYFESLRRCLRRVSLQFRRQRTDCFGTKLIKVFAENAKVLEELCVDAGNERIGEHMNLEIKKWIANSSKRRRIDSASATKQVRVLSLTRSN